jgi:hypothetical protein
VKSIKLRTLLHQCIPWRGGNEAEEDLDHDAEEPAGALSLARCVQAREQESAGVQGRGAGHARAGSEGCEERSNVRLVQSDAHGVGLGPRGVGLVESVGEGAAARVARSGGREGRVIRHPRLECPIGHTAFSWGGEDEATSRFWQVKTQPST